MNDQVIIRKEEEQDYYEVEHVTQRAFWNKYRPGCVEHYLVHKLRRDQHYLPELSRVAVLNGKIVGCIMYARAWVKDGEKTYELANFGPLCVDPDYQGLGIGGMLVRETIILAEKAGLPGIIIYGEPDYYPRLGFKTCDYYGITTPEGENFPAFMGYELGQNRMKEIHGKCYVADVFYQLPEEEVEAYNRKFPFMPKREEENKS